VRGAGRRSTNPDRRDCRHPRYRGDLCADRPVNTGRRRPQVHSRAGDLWRERFASEGAIELDDPPLRIEIAELYAATEAA
jgi:hypothetical protein